MGAGHQKHEAMIRSLDFSATAFPLSIPQREGCSLFGCSVMSDSATPCTAAHQDSLSFTISQSLLNLMSIESVMPGVISSSVISFTSSLVSFPASGSFQVRQFFQSGGQSIGASASASVLPWIFRVNFLSDGLVWSPFSSRDSQEYYPARQFKSINSWHSAFFMVWLSHP